MMVSLFLLFKFEFKKQTNHHDTELSQQRAYSKLYQKIDKLVIQCAFNKKTLTKLKRTNKVYGTSIPDASIIKDISDRNTSL
jgi:hypothetical protein